MAEQVRIIVVNWNGRAFLEECLQSIREQTYRSFSVVLVDNGSTDGSLMLVRNRFPEVQVIALPENRGFAAANNCALQGLGTPYAALLNNDAVAEPGWLGSLVEALEQTKEAGFAASKMLYYHQPDVIDRCGDGYTRAGVGLLRGRGEPASNYDRREWVFGACAGAALYRTDMLRDIGLFDEDFFLIHEDLDLSFRAQLRGYRCLYVPEARVLHKASGSLVYDSPVSVYYGHRNLEWTYLKNMPGRLMLRTILPHFFYDLAAFGYFTFQGRSFDYLLAKRDAWRGFQRARQKRVQVQKNRRVSDQYIWSLFSRERIFPRFLNRLRKRANPDTRKQ